MSFPAYDSYQESDIQFLGEVPTHWDFWKLSHAFTQIGSGTTPKSDKPEYYDEGTIPWVNTGDLNDGTLNDCAKRITEKALEDHSTLKIYPDGSLLFAMYGATIGKLGLLRFPATVNQACCVFSGESPIAVEFLFYWFLGLRQKILSLATGGGQPNVSQDILRTLIVACPYIEEQKAIASFLDVETGKIDGLVLEQRRLIELLKEKRQAVISHAVTKGLNPNAPMKPSGIQWLGDVPQHWSVIALKHLVSRPIIDGPHVSPQKHDEGVPFISAESIGKGFTDFDKKWGYISPEDHELYCQRYKPEKGDILLVELGATTGVPAIVETEADFNIWVPLAAIRLKEHIQPRFIFHVLRSNNLRVAYELNWTFGTQQTLGLGTISNLKMPIPTEEERQEIVNYLDSVLGGFDSLVAEAERAIELLQERRTALISAAVTGKIDVRGFSEKVKS